MRKRHQQFVVRTIVRCLNPTKSELRGKGLCYVRRDGIVALSCSSTIDRVTPPARETLLTELSYNAYDVGCGHANKSQCSIQNTVR